MDAAALLRLIGRFTGLPVRGDLFTAVPKKAEEEKAVSRLVRGRRPRPRREPERTLLGERRKGRPPPRAEHVQHHQRRGAGPVQPLARRNEGRRRCIRRPLRAVQRAAGQSRGLLVGMIARVSPDISPQIAVFFVPIEFSRNSFRGRIHAQDTARCASRAQTKEFSLSSRVHLVYVLNLAYSTTNRASPLSPYSSSTSSSSPDSSAKLPIPSRRPPRGESGAARAGGAPDAATRISRIALCSPSSCWRSERAARA